jgi:hypothetical protein
MTNFELMKAIIELSERIDAMEEKSVANITTFNENMDFLVNRLDAIDAKVDALTHPIVVDKDGEVIEVTDALVAMFDGFQASVKAEVAEVKAWFQQHIDDHAKNGGILPRPPSNNSTNSWTGPFEGRRGVEPGVRCH